MRTSVRSIVTVTAEPLPRIPLKFGPARPQNPRIRCQKAIHGSNDSRPGATLIRRQGGSSGWSDYGSCFGVSEVHVFQGFWGLSDVKVRYSRSYYEDDSSVHTPGDAVLTTRAALDHWIRRIHAAKLISLVCISAFPAFAQSVSPTLLAFNYQSGSNVPPNAQMLQVTGGSSFSVGYGSCLGKLTISPDGGKSPSTVSVSLSQRFLTQINMSPGGSETCAFFVYIYPVDMSRGEITTATVTLLFTVTAPANSPVITSVVNGASFKSGVGPGTWVSIFGSKFTATTSEVSAPFSTSLSGVSAQLSGVGGAYSLLMYYVSPTQINAFVPLEVARSLFGNPCSVAVTTAGGTSSYTTQCQSLTPALFNYGTQHYASATHIDGTIVGVIPGTSPAQSGSIITLWGTGFGQTTPPTSTTSINYSGTGGVLASPVVILVDNTPATVLYAGMVGVGLYQFNIQLPDGLASGDYSVTVQISGLTTDPVMLPVR